MGVSLLDQLGALHDGIWHVSEHRDFAEPEADYTQRHNIKVAPNAIRGRTMARLLDEIGADRAGPALEIGCGTGLLTATLARYAGYPTLIVSDVSVNFLRITRENMAAIGQDPKSLAFALFAAEDIRRIPANSLSAVFIERALHHIDDWKGFLAQVHRALRPSGIIFFNEPCIELRIIYGMLLKMLVSVAAAHGEPLSPDELQRVNRFCNAQVTYASQVQDKSKIEEKHCFRVDQVLSALDDIGFSFKCYPNALADSLKPASLERRLREILYVSAQLPQSTLDKLTRLMAPAIEYLLRFDEHKSAPYSTFICVGKKVST